MVFQLVIGSLLILATVLLAAIFAATAVVALDKSGAWMVQRPHWPKFVMALVGIVLWEQLAATIMVWIWAGLFLWLGIFSELEPAVYFSVVSFTTLGFGDIILPVEWRILSGLSAANGLLMFGFFTAFLVEMMRRIRREQIRGVGEID